MKNVHNHIALLFFVLVGGNTHALGQAGDTLMLGKGFSELAVNSQLAFFSSDLEIDADSAIKTFRQHPQLVTKGAQINFGPVNGYYWFALPITNQSDKPQKIVFEVRQPHIYRMGFYEVEKDSIIKFPETGIHFKFYDRPIPVRYFDFPMEIAPGESTTALLMIHHINSLTLPIFVLTEDAMNQNNYSRNIIWGYWFGFLSFCALFALIASLLVKRLIFFWYFCYIFSAALYGFTDQGYGFQFFFPGLADFAAPAIIQLSVYIFIFLIKFSQGLLETKKHLPGTHRILNAIVYFCLAMIVAGIFMQPLMFKISTIILPLINLVMLTGLVLLAYSGVKAFFRNRIIAVFYLVAYSTLISTSIFTIFTYGFGTFQYVGPNPVLLAYFFEAMLLSIAIVILFQRIYRERTELLLQVSRHQKEMYQNYIDGIEKERIRIAGELHDDIGSRLSHLQRLVRLHGEDSLKTSDQLEKIIQDVRQLSHDLAPPLAHVSGLVPLIEKLIADVRETTHIDVKMQVHDYIEKLAPQQIQQVYRIVQEALNNIAAHSGASQAHVQIFGHDDEFHISIEDNGKGFDPSLASGLGLNTMRIRTESLGGRIEINSHVGRGTDILIQIPYSRG